MVSFRVCHAPPRTSAYTATLPRLGRDRDDAERAAAAVDDLERRGNHDGTGRRQLVEIAETREAELARAVHDRVIRERRIERPRLAGIGANRLGADAQHVAILREHLRRARIEARAVRSI